jgi:ATP-dependent DNA helicase RecG
MKDLEIAKALQLGETVRGEFIPNMAGLLFLGREKTLQKAIPTHEVAFQVLDRALNVKVNDFFRSPLLKVVEEIQGRFDARVEEEEIMMGMYRLPLPEYGRRAFREALLNALLHRDYSQMGTVYVQWYHDHILMTNPGGLPLGITLQNILVHEPKPRNPVLYNAAKRIGLVERTGRGVDKIYEGQIRSGHAPPSYGRSDMNAVRLVLVGGRADQAFARYIYELDRDVTRIEFDDLLLLHRLYSQGDASKVEIAALVQKTNEETLGILERLKGFDVIQLVAKKPGEVYVLKAAFSSRAGPDEWRDGILDFVRKNERITRLQAMALFGLSRGQASRLLRKMSTEGLLRQHGASPKGTYYTVGDEDGE